MAAVTTLTPAIRGASEIWQDQLLAYVKSSPKYTPDLEKAIRLYFAIAPVWGIRADLMVGQMLKETDYLTSWWATVHHNMAGIGVTGTTPIASPAKPKTSKGYDWQFDDRDSKWHQGLHFNDLVAGIMAHFAHMLAYISLTFDASADRYDERYSVALAARKGKPVAVLITDLNDSWAVTKKNGVIVPNFYGETIMATLAAASAYNVPVPAPAPVVTTAPPPVYSDGLVYQWIALDIAIQALNQASTYQDQAFYNKIYGELAGFAKLGIKSDWPNNLLVQAAFFALRNELLDRANKFYEPIKAR